MQGWVDSGRPGKTIKGTKEINCARPRMMATGVRDSGRSVVAGDLMPEVSRFEVSDQSGWIESLVLLLFLVEKKKMEDGRCNVCTREGWKL